MARFETAGQIINDVALECGLLPVPDPYSSQDQAFQQLTGLLNAAGRELVDMFNWEMLQSPFSITTQVTDDGSYELPNDFDHFINQTGWNLSANTPINGPLSVQQWAAIEGQNVGSTTLFATFLLSGSQILLYPQPVPVDITLNFKYISRNWVMDEATVRKDRASISSDVVLYDPILTVKFLKVKFLAAKGYDIAVASREFDMCFMSRTGMDKGAPILAMSGGRTFPYINMWNNVPWSNFGL